MKQKCLVMFGIGIMVAIGLLDSCVSFGGLKAAPIVQEQGRITSKTVASVKKEYLDIGNYRKVVLAESIFEALDLDKELQADEKYHFTQQLFDQLPLDDMNGPGRKVAIKKYFSDGGALEFKVKVLDLPPERKTVARRAVIIQSNAVVLPRVGSSGGVMRGHGEFRNIDDNVSFLWVDFGDGRVVSFRYLFETKGIPDFDPTTADSMEKVNATDFILKDEMPGNDEQVPLLLDEVLADPDATTEIRTAAGLNRFLYHLSHRDIPAASTQLEDLVASVNAASPADVQLAILHQAVPMMEMMKNLEARAE